MEGLIEQLASSSDLHDSIHAFLYFRAWHPLRPEFVTAINVFYLWNRKTINYIGTI